MKLILVTGLLLVTSVASSQVIERKKEEVKNKSEQRVDNKSSEAIDKGLDKVEKGIGNIFKKKSKKKQNQQNENSQNLPPVTKSQNKDSVNNDSPKSNSQFDFIPGSKVLYFDDFQRLSIGDFPAEFNTNASGEVVNVSGKQGKWLSMTKNGVFIPESIKELPDNFTLEFEVGIQGDPTNNYSGFGINFTTNKDNLFKDVLFSEGSSVLYLHPGADLASVQLLPQNGTEINNDIQMPQWSVNGKRFAKVSIWRQKGRLRLYVNENKLVDMPRFFTDNNPHKLAFFRRFFGDCEIFITNIRFAVAGEDTRNKLITEGKFVTTGIQFDVNSDAIKPESGAVLMEMATTLKENPTVNIKIIGHTDSDGDANVNLTLSQKRALAVKNALINFYGISASRIQTDGKGESQPVQPNTTVEGKAQNRRVEFIKQ